jgi:hypothetical protein
MTINVMICIHGMSPESHPVDAMAEFSAWYDDLVTTRPSLAAVLPKEHLIGVQWGHPWADEPLPPGRPDLQLMTSQEHVVEQTSYRSVSQHPGPDNVVLRGLGRDWAAPWWEAMRGMMATLRETIILRGVGDVIYYVSAAGEAEVRKLVYGTVLRRLDELAGEAAVRMHVVSHSLGVAIAHDFLYGLFAPGIEPDFIHQEQGDADDRDRYQRWRDRAQAGTLALGSLTSFASQLPLFTMRVPKVIDMLYQGQGLDPALIGIPPEPGRTVWQLFYDIDDPLAFCTRGLYTPDHAIREFQVDCGDDLRTHSNYWKHSTVLQRTAELIEANSA